MGALDKTKELMAEIKRLGNRSIESLANEAFAEILGIQGENIELKEKVLTAERQAQQTMISDGVVLWSSEQKRTPQDGPFCPGCWGIKSKAVHLRSTARGHWYCMGCQQGISDANAPSKFRKASDHYDPLG